MAKIVSLIQYVGKAGNTVGQKGPKGGIVFKQKAASVNNPRTDAQMQHRAKMKLAAQVAGIAVDAGTKPTGADLVSSVTIAIGGFQALIAKALA